MGIMGNWALHAINILLLHDFYIGTVLWCSENGENYATTTTTCTTIQHVPLVGTTSGPIPRVFGCGLTSYFGELKIPIYPASYLRGPSTLICLHYQQDGFMK